MIQPRSFEYDLLPLEKLSIHEAVSSDTALSVFGLSYDKDSKTTPSDAALKLMLYAHPVIAIKRKNNTFGCIGGFRSYKAASSCLPPTHEIPVLLIDIPINKISRLASIETFLSNINYDSSQTSSAESMINIWNLLEEDDKQLIAPKLKSKAAFARLLGISSQKLQSILSRESSKTEVIPSNPSNNIGD